MLIGHQEQWKFLRKGMELKRIPHALLFCGPEKIGKRTLAVEFVKFLNCSEKDINKKPCQTCWACRAIQKNSHPDLITISPKADSKEIQISQIRELIRKLSFKPHSSSFKAAILDQAHSMTREAQGSFLKLLEEPGGNAVLFLITEYPEMLLGTIISRVQKIKFFPVKNDEIERYLETRSVPEERKKEIVFFSSGRPGRVFDFLDDPEQIETQKHFISGLLNLKDLDLVSRFQYAQSLSKKGPETKNALKEVLDIWLGYFRNLLIAKIKEKEKKNFPRDYSADKYSLDEIEKIIKSIQKIRFLLTNTNVNQRIAFESLLLNI